GGGFISEFVAYHGVWYQGIHERADDPARCFTAGHVHVGQRIPWETAAIAAEITLRTVLDAIDAQIPSKAILSGGRGAVNVACGSVESVLSVAGSTGGFTRAVDVGFGDPVSLAVREPFSMRGDGLETPLCVYGWVGAPGDSDLVEIPGGFGSMVF